MARQIKYGSRKHLSSWSWMYFPKRLLLLFLSVQALPTSEPSVRGVGSRESDMKQADSSAHRTPP